MMELLNSFNAWAVGFMDRLLGWMLSLPMDVDIVIVAIGTSAILTFVRLFTTNQRHLGQCNRDRKRLKQLIRQARKQHDKAAVRRHRATIGMIGMETMKAEFVPLLVSLIPIVFLASWAFARLAYVPLAPGQAVTLKAYFPVASVGQLTHIVPQAGLEALEAPAVKRGEISPCSRMGLHDGQWVQRIVEDKDARGNVVNGLACWTLRAAGSNRPYDVTIRHNGAAVTKELTVDGRRYSPPVEVYAGGKVLMAQLDLKPYRFLGLVPGLPQIYLDPWVVAYLLIAVPFVLILKKVFRIY